MPGTGAGAVGPRTWRLYFQSAKGLHSPSRTGHISCMPDHAPSLSAAQVLFFNLLVGAGIKVPLTVSSTASAAGALAPLSTLLLLFPSRAGSLCTHSSRDHVLETMGIPAPAPPSTDLEGCEVHSPSPASCHVCCLLAASQHGG